MVNQPGKPAATGRFPAPKEGGEEVRNYEALLDQYGARKFAEGEVMQGTVLKLTSTDVIVDIGYKSDGIIAVSQFIDATGQLAVDERFREEGASQPGFRMDNKTWPHGGAARGIPHGAVFSRPLAAGR